MSVCARGGGGGVVNYSEKWGDSLSLEGLDWERDILYAHFIFIRRIKGRSALRFPHQQRMDVSSKRVGVTRKGATASRLGREETSQEEAEAPLLALAPVGEVAPQAPLPRPGPPPLPALLRSTQPFKLPPKSNYVSVFSYPRTHPN